MQVTIKYIYHSQPAKDATGRDTFTETVHIEAYSEYQHYFNILIPVHFESEAWELLRKTIRVWKQRV